MSELNWRKEVTVYNLPDAEDYLWFVFSYHAPAAHSPAARKVQRYRGEVSWSLWVPLSTIRAFVMDPKKDDYYFRIHGRHNSRSGEPYGYILSPIQVDQFVNAMTQVLTFVEHTVIESGKSVRFYRELPSDSWLNAETHPPIPCVPPPMFPSKKRSLPRAKPRGRW